MKKIKLTITGCLGRMGQQLIKSSKKTKNFKVVSITESRTIKKRILGLQPQLNSKNAFKNTNVFGKDLVFDENANLITRVLSEHIIRSFASDPWDADNPLT